MTTDINHVKNAVRETMTDQFKSVKIRDIIVNDDTDQYGDDVLRIDVISDGHPLNPKVLPALFDCCGRACSSFKS